MIPIFFIVLPIKSFHKHNKILSILRPVLLSFTYIASRLQRQAEGRSARGIQPALAGQRSPRLPSSRHPLPDILLYNGLIFNIHFTNFSSPISFSVVSLFLYPSSCSSLPVRDAMQFHAQLIAAFLCGLPLSSVQLLVVSMCGLLCSSMFSCSSLLVWVAL